LRVGISVPLFEPIIIPLSGAASLERSGFPMRGPIPALLHRAGKGQRKILVYVPGGVPGAPMCGPYDYAALALHLAEIGYSLVVPQMSTSQKLTPSPLLDCVNDIQLVLAWCKAEGFDHLAIAGNGLGAARIVYWAAQASDGAVESLALLSPAESPYLAMERCGSRERKAARDEILRACKSLIAAGRGQEIVEADLDGGRRAFTAEGFRDCFGPPEEASTTIVRFASQIKVPTCIIQGDLDPVAPPDGACAVLNSLTQVTQRKMFWIAGGDHHLLANPATVEPSGRAICAWLSEPKQHPVG
jgi:pimeloyl-ACP methyl ester carboxylesterase